MNPYAIMYTKNGLEGNYTHTLYASNPIIAAALFSEQFPNTRISKVWLNEVQLEITRSMNTVDTKGD